MRIVVKRIPLIAATAMLLFIGFASATQTAPLTFNNIQELNGQIFKINGGFTFVVAGFHAAGANATATNSCSWTSTNFSGVNAPVCTTNLTAGDWIYEVIMRLNTVPPVNTPYTMLVHMNAISNAIFFNVPSNATANTYTVFDFDAGTAIWTSPLVFVTEVY
jgi:hypothetical protein